MTEQLHEGTDSWRASYASLSRLDFGLGNTEPLQGFEQGCHLLFGGGCFGKRVQAGRPALQMVQVGFHN